MLKVGVIDYINFLPFFAAFEQGVFPSPVQWVLGVPSALNVALRKGELDISPISSAEYLANSSIYGLMPGFCIGAEDHVMSINFYTKVKVQDLGGKIVGLTPQSTSAALLVKVLCHHFWKASPKFVCLDDQADLKRCDAFLMIGDDALLNPRIASFTTIDLAHIWHKETKLPFTFAIFAARNEILATRPHEVEALGTAFQRAFSWAIQNSDTLEALARKRVAIPPERIKEYYKLLRFRFDDKQQQGLALFGQLVEALPEDQKIAPVRGPSYVH